MEVKAQSVVHYESLEGSFGHQRQPDPDGLTRCTASNMAATYFLTSVSLLLFSNRAGQDPLRTLDKLNLPFPVCYAKGHMDREQQSEGH
jgi:hypothetical protein